MMARTTFRQSAMAALLVMLLPAAAVSSVTVQDEKDVPENKIAHLRQRKVRINQVVVKYNINSFLTDSVNPH